MFKIKHCFHVTFALLHSILMREKFNFYLSLLHHTFPQESLSLLGDVVTNEHVFKSLLLSPLIYWESVLYIIYLKR